MVIIKVIESDFDTFKFQRAFVVDADGRGALAAHAMISDVECLVDTKESLLAARLAFLQPLDPVMVENWPVYTDVVIDGHQQRMYNITNHPKVVAAAERFEELKAAGEAKAGMEL